MRRLFWNSSYFNEHRNLLRQFSDNHLTIKDVTQNNHKALFIKSKKKINTREKHTED